MKNKIIKIGISLALFAMVLTACNKGNPNNEANIFHGVLPVLSENALGIEKYMYLEKIVKKSI